jgi:hypothetical protein
MATGAMAKQRKPATKVMKGNDARKPSYSRFQDIHIPTQKDKVIRPESIFDGFKNTDKKKDKKTAENRKTRSGKRY